MYNDIEGSIYVTNVPSETKRVFLKGNAKLTSIDARTYENNDAEFLLDLLDALFGPILQVYFLNSTRIYEAQ